MQLLITESDNMSVVNIENLRVANIENFISLVKLNNGDSYEGRIHNGMMTGFGTEYGKAIYCFANGDAYQGHFGYSPDDASYTYPDNWGKFTWANGSTYEGQFVDGRMSGDGTFIHYNKVTTISASFLDWEDILNRMILPDKFYYKVPEMEYYKDFEKNIVETSGYRTGY